jgi:hypothetical protein
VEHCGKADIFRRMILTSCVENRQLQPTQCPKSIDHKGHEVTNDFPAVATANSSVLVLLKVYWGE